jgi:hypothetical protein
VHGKSIAFVEFENDMLQAATALQGLLIEASTICKTLSAACPTKTPLKMT